MKKIYLVGGAVRDELLGLEPKDLDYVVVGSTPEEMIAEGYKQVGADFPIFLHPGTGDEYALARTEYKDGVGYQGFKCAFGPEVTLEDDLSRRDLTINAMAKDLSTGEIIDPFGGQDDIKLCLLRPVSEAFSEDPVRILRAARFLARYPEFASSIELFDVKGAMVSAGELEHLVPERVWQELVGALSEKMPSRFFTFLLHTGLFPELECMTDLNENNRWHPESSVFKHIMLGIDYSVSLEDPVTTFGVLCHDMGKPEAYAATEGLKSTRHEQLGVPIVKAFCERLRAPNEYRDMALKAAEFHTHVHLSFDMKPKTIHKLFKRFKTQDDFMKLLDVAVADKSGRGKPACDWVYTQPTYLFHCYRNMKLVDTKAISGSMEPGPKVGEAIRRAEIAAIASVNKEQYRKPYDECHAKVIADWEKANV